MLRRGFVFLAASTIAIGSGFDAPGFAQETNSISAIQRIKAKGTLTVAIFFEDVTPFFYTNKAGNFVGIDPILAKDIADKLGVTVTFNRNAQTFDGLIDEVTGGRADMAISLLSDTLDRAVNVAFSDSYVSVRQFLLINRLELGKLIQQNEIGETSVRALLNSKIAKIGVISGTSYIGFVRDDFPMAQRIEFEGFSDMVAAVKSGALTALLYDEIEIGNWRISDPAGSVELRPFFLEGRPDTIAIAMRQEDQDLKNWTNLYLKKVRENDFLPFIVKTYLYSPERLILNE